MTEVPPLPSGRRPETGPMRIGDDWPGVFIRGDDALHYGMMLGWLVRERRDCPAFLERLGELLGSCHVAARPDDSEFVSLDDTEDAGRR